MPKKSNKAKAVPEVMNFFWVGSPLKPKHIQAITKWAKLNPDYKINLFVDDQYVAATQKHFPAKAFPKVKALRASSVPLPENVQKLVDKMRQQAVPNYGAISDAYRFYILKTKKGGWYIEPDVVPVDLSKIKIDPKLRAIFNAKRKGNDLDYLSPSIMAVCENNPIIDVAIKIIEATASIYTRPENIDIICNSEVNLRKHATFGSTGSTLSKTLGITKIDGKIFYSAYKEKEILDPELFDRLTHEFDEENEKAWLYAHIQAVGNAYQAYLLPGMTMEDEKKFVKPPKYYRLLNMRNDVVDQIKPYEYEVEPVIESAEAIDELPEPSKPLQVPAGTFADDNDNSLWGRCLRYTRELVDQCPSYFPPNNYNYWSGSSSPTLFNAKSNGVQNKALPAPSQQLGIAGR